MLAAVALPMVIALPGLGPGSAPETRRDPCASPASRGAIVCVVDRARAASARATAAGRPTFGLVGASLLLGAALGIPLGAAISGRDAPATRRVVRPDAAGVVTTAIAGATAAFLARPGSDAIVAFVIVGAVATAAIASRTARAVGTVLDAPYMRFARAQGLPLRRRVIVYALPVLAPEVLRILARAFAEALGFALLVEAVVTQRGLGGLAANALHARDTAMLAVLGAIVIALVIVVHAAAIAGVELLRAADGRTR